MVPTPRPPQRSWRLVGICRWREHPPLFWREPGRWDVGRPACWPAPAPRCDWARGAWTARAACEQIQETAPAGRLSPWATADVDSVRAALTDAQLLIAAGTAGVELAEQKLLQEARDLRVAIDLNAVPPLGLGGLEVTDSARDRQGVICYGAIGVGGTKMKIHKAALRRLFQDSQLVLDAEEIYAIGGDLESGSA